MSLTFLSRLLLSKSFTIMLETRRFHTNSPASQLGHEATAGCPVWLLESSRSARPLWGHPHMWGPMAAGTTGERILVLAVRDSKAHITAEPLGPAVTTIENINLNGHYYFLLHLHTSAVIGFAFCFSYIYTLRVCVCISFYIFLLESRT